MGALRAASAGLRQRDQNRAGRSELLQTPFSKFERNIRDQLGRMLGGAGFGPARDIEGITVNRWVHGYAFTPNPLFDPDWKEEEKPWVIGRKPFGKIAIANSDAGASANTDVAIDQAWRAVRELLAIGLGDEKGQICGMDSRPGLSIWAVRPGSK